MSVGYQQIPHVRRDYFFFAFGAGSSGSIASRSFAKNLDIDSAQVHAFAR